MSWPEQVAVIGAGYMGQGIAESLALAGCDCVLADQTPELSAAALARLTADAGDHEVANLIPAGGAALVRAKVTAARSIEEASATADLVIEAVFELRDVKEAVLRRIAAAAPVSAVIATNTSSMSITSLSPCVTQPERFLGAHWFNPPQFVPGVELISWGGTAEDVLLRVEDLLERAHKQTGRVGDAPGFVANRLQYALFQEAAAVVEEGIATPEAVDEIVRSTFGFRLPFFGPFAIADMAGLDIYRGTYATLEEAYPDRFVAPQMLKDQIESGALGSKNGRGFVIRDAAQATAMAARRNGAYAALGRLLRQWGATNADSHDLLSTNHRRDTDDTHHGGAQK